MDACPTGALRFGEESELKELMAKAETLHPEFGTRPRVFYSGLLNKYFIAGEVFDPEADEVLEGATVTLVNIESRQSSSLQTDFFGDFWFERQQPGKYSLLIEKDGYFAKIIEPIDASKDVNVGEIELHQEVADIERTGSVSYVWQSKNSFNVPSGGW